VRRIGNIADEVASFGNIRLAWLKAARGKRMTRAVRVFTKDLDTHLEDVRCRLAGTNPQWGQYRTFRISEPKERTISAASFPERVMHHALMNILEPVFERHLIDHSYACRKGKGTHAAVRYAGRATTSGRSFAKLDMKKYFDSIDHVILKTLLRRLCKDAHVLFLLDGIIDSYETLPGKGLPIGNLTSQYFANYYLSCLDHYILEHLHPIAYVRYMDDCVLWAKSSEAIRQMVAAVRTWTEERLHLTLKEPVCGPVEIGVPFLGFLVKPDGVFLAAKSRKRVRRRARAIEQALASGKISEEAAGDRARSVLAAIQMARTFKFRYLLWHETGLRFQPGQTGREPASYPKGNADVPCGQGEVPEG